MNRLDIVLFLAGIISIAMVTLAFFVPVFLLMIHKNVKETNSLIEELLREVRMMNYLNRAEETEECVSPDKDNCGKEEKLSKLGELFLELSSGESTVEFVTMEEENGEIEKSTTPP